MSMRAITARLTDKPVKLDDAQEPRVLTTLKMIYEGGSLDGKAIYPHATSPASWLVFIGVIGISLKLISARSTSVLVTNEQSFTTRASFLNPTTAVGGRGCSRFFASAN
jgi:hypothetical protein